ncbi:ABC transporter permease [Frondihabitans sp. PAMC 28766]|uniref:ABC transporter permease n=1 Tax=Frondihabitans sp. PAMC 28766 TaxID=1795630 RepID=UPI0012FF5FFD|nr:ABC transporter permease [Frondihabitans sp. PAMC 28766]
MTTTADSSTIGGPDAPQGEHEHRHAAPRAGAYSRFRDTYEKLPPGVQLIGLQLWLPFFFVIAFCFCYVLAFHAPAPKDVPVAVIGSSSQTTRVADGLATQTKGEFAVSTVPTLAQARADVKSGDLAAAYLPGAKTSTLVIASGAQYQLATISKSVFTAAATASGSTLAVDDVAPLPASDSFGTTLFYVTLVFMIGGYMTGMFVGLMGGPLRHRVRLGIIAGVAVIIPLIVTILTHVVLGAVLANFFELWGLASSP